MRIKGCQGLLAVALAQSFSKSLSYAIDSVWGFVIEDILIIVSAFHWWQVWKRSTCCFGFGFNSTVNSCGHWQRLGLSELDVGLAVPPGALGVRVNLFLRSFLGGYNGSFYNDFIRRFHSSVSRIARLDTIIRYLVLKASLTCPSGQKFFSFYQVREARLLPPVTFSAPADWYTKLALATLPWGCSRYKYEDHDHSMSRRPD